MGLFSFSDCVLSDATFADRPVIHSGSMAEERIIRVFIASPGDLAIERRAFKDTIDELNRGFGEVQMLSLCLSAGKTVLSQVGRRSQAVINQDVDACDVFILVMCAMGSGCA